MNIKTKTRSDEQTDRSILAALQPLCDARTICLVNGCADKLVGAWESTRDSRSLLRTYRYNHRLLCVDVLKLAPGHLPEITGHERAQ